MSLGSGRNAIGLVDTNLRDLSFFFGMGFILVLRVLSCDQIAASSVTDVRRAGQFQPEHLTVDLALVVRLDIVAAVKALRLTFVGRNAAAGPVLPKCVDSNTAQDRNAKAGRYILLFV